MKFLAIIFALALCCNVATGQELHDLVEQTRALVSVQAKELQVSIAKLAEARDNGSRLADELEIAKTEIGKVAKERDDWKQYSDEVYQKWMNAEVRVAKEQAAVLRRNILIGAMGVAIAAYVVAKLYLGKLMPF